ncbi:MAG TPA: FkbM family methyltransferase [Pseudolabrys sp.]|nr:FkbM family methyltransferase [Pseudolabrys sp.]
MKELIRKVRANHAIASALYAATRPLHGLARRFESWTSTHVFRNGGAAVYDGIDLHFPRNVGIALLTSISWRGVDGFEPETWAALRQLIRRSHTFVDIGAHVGLYSILAKRIAPAIDVISFEPVPELYDQNRAFHAANGLAPNAQQIAISDRDGVATLFRPEGGETPSSSTLAVESWQARKPHTALSVRTVTLDSFLSGRPLRGPVTIKIDVEDHEAAVLRGGADVIRKYKPAIVCEILPRPRRKNDRVGNEIISRGEQHENAETLAILAELNYSAFAITADGYFRVGARDFREDRPFLNFLLLPTDEIDASRHYFRDIPPRLPA